MMDFSDEELLRRVPKHDFRAISRLITLSENRIPRAQKIQAKLFKQSGKAHVIGITGSPGAGKSTLVDQLARTVKKDRKKVGIVAVDPTSPFSGGAILGDRIRMHSIAEDPDIFIRSMATRGALGGISRATIDAVQILDSAGFDIILVETVGVGQAEVDIIRIADTCIVTLVPGMGDSVQAIKAGILEIADLFVINKADREGVDLLQKDLRVLLSLVEFDNNAWKPPILRTIATTGEGVKEVYTELEKHHQWLISSEEGEKRRLRVIEHTILKLVSDLTVGKVMHSLNKDLKRYVMDCYERKLDPYSAVEKLLRKL